MESRDKILKQFKEAANKTETATSFPGIDKVWGRVEEKLDADRRKKAIPFRRIAAAAAMLLLAGSVAVYFLFRKDTAQPEQRYAATPARPVPATTPAVSLPVPEQSVLTNGDMVSAPQKPVITASRELPVNNGAQRQSAPVAANTPPAHTELPGRTISGMITDEEGLGIPGASVTIKGTFTGTATDVNGHYELLLPAQNDTLVVAADGASPKYVAIGEAAIVSVTLPATSESFLDRTVYKQPRQLSYKAGAPARITNEKISAAPQSNIMKSGLPDMLAVSGDNRPEGYLRRQAQRVLNDSAAPLIIVDGKVFKGKLSDIDPDDIQSVTILKDAEASSLYGNTGANGVLVFGGGESGIDTQIVIRRRQKSQDASNANAPMIVVDGKIYEGRLSDLDPESIQSMTIVKGTEAAVLYGSRDGNGVLAIKMKKKDNAQKKGKKNGKRK